MDKHTLIENVCSKCAGTEWGISSFCSVKNKHIGHVESCPSWDSFIADQQGIAKGQQVLIAMEPAMEHLQKTLDAIQNYRFWKREIDRLREVLGDAGNGAGGSGGDPNAYIRSQNKNSDKTVNEVIHRDRDWKRLRKFEESVARFDRARETITDDKESVMLQLLLDKFPVNEIALHIDVSRQKAHEIKNTLIKRLAFAMYEEN